MPLKSNPTGKVPFVSTLKRDLEDKCVKEFRRFDLMVQLAFVLHRPVAGMHKEAATIIAIC